MIGKILGFLPGPGKAVGFLMKNWKIIVIIIAIIGAFMYVKNLQNNVEKWRAKYNKSEMEYSVLFERTQSNELKLKASILSQNEKITKLGNHVKQQEEEIELIITENKKVQSQYDKSIALILQDKRPETCQASIEYLINGVEELTKW